MDRDHTRIAFLSVATVMDGQFTFLHKYCCTQFTFIGLISNNNSLHDGREVSEYTHVGYHMGQLFLFQINYTMALNLQNYLPILK